MWITIHIYSCVDLMHYMNNAWSYETDPSLVFYELHNTWYPHKQVKLLRLYDDLGLLHDKKKQVFGMTLKIIGLFVNPTDMTISMSDRSCSDLTMAVRAFIDTSMT